MANLPESATYDAGIYQLETTDAVVGGAAGKSNAPAINLANRTAYLKAHVDLMETIVPQAEAEAGIATTLRGWNALRVRQAVMAATGGLLSKSVAGGTTTTLTAAEAGNGILKLTGALTADKAVVVPTSPTRSWIINNATTGAYTLTVKTAAGSGVICAQGKHAAVYTDGVNVYDALTSVTTPPQFDNSRALATTEFAMRMGLRSTPVPIAIVSNTVLPPSSAGSYIISNLGSGAVTCTLPLLSSVPAGSAYIIEHSSTAMSSFSVLTQGSDILTFPATLNKAPYAMLRGEAIIVFSTGSEWRIASSNGADFLNNTGIFDQILGSTGEKKLPGGFIMKWAYVIASATPGAAQPITFPIAFPNACLALVIVGVTVNTSNAAVWHDSQSASGFNLRAALASQGANYIAFGY